MLDAPLSDSQGNKLNLVRVMPDLSVDIVVTAADQRVVNFRTDPKSLRALSAALAAAADAAERVASA